MFNFFNECPYRMLDVLTEIKKLIWKVKIVKIKRKAYFWNYKTRVYKKDFLRKNGYINKI